MIKRILIKDKHMNSGVVFSVVGFIKHPYSGNNRVWSRTELFPLRISHAYDIFNHTNHDNYELIISFKDGSVYYQKF